MAALNPADRYDDVKAYTTQAKLAQQAGTPHLIPWPPKDERLALRCMDAYYNEQIAYYSGWCKQTNMKHIDLPAYLFQQWKSMPGRLTMYNRRKELKTEWDKKNVSVAVGMSACTNPFADPDAVAAERQQTEEFEAAALAQAAVSSGNPLVDQVRRANSDMPTTFVDGSPSLPPLQAAPPPRDIVHSGSGQMNVFVGATPLPQVQKRPSTVLVLDDEKSPEPSKKKTFPPVPRLDAAPSAQATAAKPAPTKKEDKTGNTSDEEPSPTEMKNMMKELMRQNKQLQAQLKAANPVKKEPIS